MADMRNVIFMRCSQNEYDNLKASNLINANTIYYITDGGNIYQGNISYGTKFVNSNGAGNSEIESNTFRYDKRTGEVRYYPKPSESIVVNRKEQDIQDMIDSTLSWKTFD